VRDIAAADIESPCNRVGVRHDKRIRAQLADLVADARKLALRVFARKTNVMRHDLAGRRRWPIGPHRVDRI
jgi:hypothetical protein